MAKTYEEHVDDIQSWLADTAGNEFETPDQRDWCVLGITESFDAEDVHAYFDNSQLNTDFQTEYDNVNGTGGQGGVFTNKPIMYNQTESDQIDGLAKMFIYRHQPRLKNYRDDVENKNIRTYSSLSLAMAKYALLKNVNQT